MPDPGAMNALKGTALSPMKRIVARLPERWQTELKRIHFARQIKRGTFVTDEPEYAMLDQFISDGDWVIDIGANVGHYTKRFSELVGPKGRVIAIEPVPTTFSLLSANAQMFKYPNVTLINAAVSNELGILGISIPKLPTGLLNYYMARLVPAEESALPVMTLSLDALCFEKRIGLVKIDAEGHEALVLSGMHRLIDRFHPVLIVETGSEEIIEDLSSRGYHSEHLRKSPNVLFKPNTEG